MSTTKDERSDPELLSLTIDGHPAEARPGERLLQVAKRLGLEIPTLCHDERLKPAGVCRACLVEIDGQRRLQPACTFEVSEGMVVHSESARVKRHRKALYGLYLADHGQDGRSPPRRSSELELEVASRSGRRGDAATVGPTAPPDTRRSGVQRPSQLLAQAHRYGAINLKPIASLRRGRPEDRNPYIRFDPQRCILCARCTRYCDEVEGVNAISLGFRGANTTVTTAGMRGLLETSCELCGGCIDTCPTHALEEQKPRSAVPAPPAQLQLRGAGASPPKQVAREAPALSQVRTTCNYCGVGCQMDLVVKEGRVHHIESPSPGTTVNDGNLCVKGRFAYDFIHHQERLRTPLIREDGVLRPASFKEALAYAAKGLLAVREKHGPGALGFVSSSRCTGEENYLLQKLARAAFGTNNCHQCAAT